MAAKSRGWARPAAAIDESGDPLWPVASFECGMPPVVTKADCAALNGTWRNSEYNFDNIGQALVVVFITSTADNWQDVMYTGIDAVALNHYMSFHSVVPAPRTILKGVRKLEPATVMVLEPSGETRTRRYWEVAFGVRADERAKYQCPMPCCDEEASDG